VLPDPERCRAPCPGLAAVLNRSFNQDQRLHGWMQRTGRRLIHQPDISLVAVPAPVMTDSFSPTIEDGLILSLVVGTADGEGVLGPDDKGGPVAAHSNKGFLQRCVVRIRHADVNRAVGKLQHIFAGLF